jgi:hypothetical protein
VSAPTAETGALGLRFSEVGETVQSLLSVLVDRGHPEGLVVASLREAIAAGRFREDGWWEDRLLPIVDELADELELERYPDEEAPAPAAPPRVLGSCSLCAGPVLDSQDFHADGGSVVYHEDCPEPLEVCETCGEPIGEDEPYVSGRSIATAGVVFHHAACARRSRRGSRGGAAVTA